MPIAATRMTRPAPALAACLVAAGLALAGCGADAADDGETAAPSVEESPAAGAETGSGGDREAAEGDADDAARDGGSPLTVRHSDEHTTVITVAPDRVAELTGVALDGGGTGAVDAAAAALAEPGTWSAYAETAGDADVVAEAAGRESDRLHGILTGASHGEDVGLRLVVERGDHRDVAHFGGHHGD